MSEHDDPSEPHTPAFTPTIDGNPWLTTLFVVGLLALIAGLSTYGAGYSDATDTSIFGDDDPAAGLAAMFAGEMFIIGGAFLVAGWLVASAICWQLRRR